MSWLMQARSYAGEATKSEATERKNDYSELVRFNNKLPLARSLVDLGGLGRFPE
jgi:hypothetical protein